MALGIALTVIGLVLTVFGLILTVLGFFAAPIYSVKIQEWWAGRSKLHIQKQIARLEKNLSKTSAITLWSTIIYVTLRGLYNLFLLIFA
jgi:hypothetical protein